MSFTIKFKDLLNLAIGTPDRGVVNFNALHMLLHSIIEHLNLEEQMKVVPGNEKDYLPPSPFQVTSGEKPGEKAGEDSEESEEDILYHTPSDRIINTLDQRLSLVESQMAFLEALPSTEQLLESSQPFKKPAQDMWQMLKLRKKVEGNEEGMTKAMETLQELLTTMYSLQSDTDGFRMEMEQLKEKVDKISLDEGDKYAQELKDQQEQMKNLQLAMEDIKNKLHSFPDGSDIMQWTTLHDAMYSQADTKETSERAEAKTSEVTPEVTSEVTPEVTSEVTPEETLKTPKAPKTPKTRMPPVKTARQRKDTLSSPLGKALVSMGIKVGPDTLPSMGIAIDPGILNAMGVTTDPETLAAMGITPVPGAGLATTGQPGTTAASSTGQSSIGPSSTGPSSTAGPPLGISPDLSWNASSFLDTLGITPDEATLDELGINTNRDILTTLGSTVDPATLVALAILTGKGLPASLRLPAPFPSLPQVQGTTTKSKTSVVPESSTSPDTTAGEGTSASVSSPHPPAKVSSQLTQDTSPAKSLKQLLIGHPLSAEGKRLTAKKSVGSLINLSIEYDSLKEQLAKLEEKVQQQANSIANLQFLSSVGLTPRLETEMSTLQDKINILQESGQKTKTYEQHLEKVQEHCNLLEKVTETLQDKMEDIKGLKIVVKQLEMRKVDKTRMEEQMKEKADKSALAFKASRADLEFATIQLNDMMHNMLQKMSVHEHDWQKVLEKLFFDVDSKLGHMDLDPVKRQMEYIWKFVKKNLSEGPRFDADSAAGFKKQLFDRVKCISCDRPVEMMTSPHMISIHKTNTCPRARPLSANSYEYLQRLKLSDMTNRIIPCNNYVAKGYKPIFGLRKRGATIMRWRRLCSGIREQQRMQQQQPTQEMTDLPEQGTDGQSYWDNNSSLRRVMKIPNLTTLYPYGDPSVFPPENSEVNILGVNGVMYKGRMDSHGAPRAVMTEKDLAGLKTPKPPSSRSGYERVRSSISSSIYPTLRPRTSMTAHVLQQFALQPMLTSGTLQHSISSMANTSSTSNRPVSRPTASGSPFIAKPGSALPSNSFHATSPKEGNKM
ncbi:uncharacterized protein C16orf96 homolog [Trichosurus vulpecula]|uniref:uncharacterized protein C16orf96 homolog n=1 Tax=Trichosurus vulpecula TaxID=9337 RepID=UPI00186AD2BA|nr:uncharacterized protein C16orf96 homolog [Trichosurus vulpecula]